MKPFIGPNISISLSEHFIIITAKEPGCYKKETTTVLFSGDFQNSIKVDKNTGYFFKQNF